MNLWCAVGRHRWMTRQGKDERGKSVTFQQCERCRHYPKTSSWLQRVPQKWEGGGTGDPGNSSGGSVAV